MCCTNPSCGKGCVPPLATLAATQLNWLARTPSSVLPIESEGHHTITAMGALSHAYKNNFKQNAYTTTTTHTIQHKVS